MKKHLISKSLLFIAVGALILATFGCSNSSSNTATNTDAGISTRVITVCLLPKKLGVPYFTSCDQGAEEAAKQLGNVKLIYNGPTSGDAADAVKLINQWVAQGVDVIAVSASDPTVIGPALKRAQQAGIKVITWDADTAPDTRSFFVNQATPKQIGDSLVDAMAHDLGGTSPSGQVAIVTATMTASNQNSWIKYMKERLLKYPKMTLVTIKPSNDDQQTAFSLTQDLTKAYPNLKGIFAISSAAFPGCAQAIERGGLTGKVLVTGLSTPNEMKPYVKDGVVKSVILWNTVDLGYLTVYVARAVANGTLKAGSTSVYAGRLGSKKVIGDNVMLGGVMIFNKANIDKYNF